MLKNVEAKMGELKKYFDRYVELLVKENSGKLMLETLKLKSG